jgi:hypothetical protein
MSKEMSVIVLGFVVVIIPHLGVPGSWHTVLFAISGLAIAILGFLLRGETISRGMRKTDSPFVESAGQTHYEQSNNQAQ